MRQACEEPGSEDRRIRVGQEDEHVGDREEGHQCHGQTLARGPGAEDRDRRRAHHDAEGIRRHIVPRRRDVDAGARRDLWQQTHGDELRCADGESPGLSPLTRWTDTVSAVPTFSRILRTLRRLVPPSHGRARPGPGARAPEAGPAASGRPYAGDATRLPDLTYAPHPDGDPDPGEIVWGWVPYEEDHTRGKDRPVLVIGHEGHLLVALQLTSRDHDRDERQERRAGREWVDIGSGAWDARGRASEVRVNRLLRLDPTTVRREGAVLSRERYEEVVAAARTHFR